MKVAILAGGVGSRLPTPESIVPKPMIEIGGRPLIWHIMRHYWEFGYGEFVVASGYLGHMISRYFAEYEAVHRDVRIHVGSGVVRPHGDDPTAGWTVDVIDTGQWTETGGRVRRLAPHLGDERFMLTFGDAVGDVDLEALLSLHEVHQRLATVTVVHPPPRFGELNLDGDQVLEFSEKPIEAGWIVGGFMVMEPEALRYFQDDTDVLYEEPLARLAEDDQLVAYRHTGFWSGVDTLRDKRNLETLTAHGTPPWQVSKRQEVPG